jgi:hypothetical protein
VSNGRKEQMNIQHSTSNERMGSYQEKNLAASPSYGILSLIFETGASNGKKILIGSRLGGIGC